MSAYTKPPHLCITKFCRRPKAPKNHRCSRCKMQAWRAENPFKAKLAWLRIRASKKHVPFDLDLPWLTWFLTFNGYDSTLHHIDRVKTWLGYTKDNLQILTSGENIAKGNRERRTVEEPF